MPGEAVSTKDTLTAPLSSDSTEICPKPASWSSSWSRWSSRSFGESPPAFWRLIVSLSWAIWLATCAIWPPELPGPAGATIESYSAARLRLDGGDLVVDLAERVGDGLRALDQRLARGRVAGRVRGVGEVGPGVPELAELGVDAVVAGLGERVLGPLQRVGAAAPLAQVRRLAAVLEVEELVADAAVARDVDARAEARGAVQRAAGGTGTAPAWRRAPPPGASSPRC